MRPVLPIRRAPTPPVKFKSETETERKARTATPGVEAPKMSNKDIALALLVTHVEDSFLRITDDQIATIAGKHLKGERPAKIREMYRGRVEAVLKSAKKLLEKRGLLDRCTSFVQAPTPAE